MAADLERALTFVEWRADGAWPSDEGAAREVHVALEALRALRLCQRL